MIDYIKRMRSLIGHETLMTIGCGAIIEDGRGEILLQRRKDNNLWGVPGGLMEIGETFIETMTREVIEETGLTVIKPKLFGIYSGEKCMADYPNGDQMFSVQIIFYVNKYKGNLIQEGEESFEHRFFSRDDIPKNLNPRQAPYILAWQRNEKETIID